MEGAVERVANEQADAYFATRLERQFIVFLTLWEDVGALKLKGADLERSWREFVF